jgi:hypothetical protein
MHDSKQGAMYGTAGLALLLCIRLVARVSQLKLATASLINVACTVIECRC